MFLQLDTVPQIPPGTTTLDLRFNHIQEILPNTFKNQGKITTLLLNNNHIIRLDNGSFDGLSQLRYLYLYKNRIKTIAKDAFRGLGKLEQLYLHFNEIRELDRDTFKNMSSLERLFLQNNKLSHVPVGIFRHTPTLKRLRLDSNALICDCAILWLANMLKDTEGSTQAAATCMYPNALQGKSITALQESEFNCKKPSIMEGPSDVELTFGGTMYLSCKVDGNPQPDVVWLHDENEIEIHSAKRHKLMHDGTLVIENAQESDQGVYECMARNVLGEAKSRKAKMKRQVRVGPGFRSRVAESTDFNNILQGSRTHFAPGSLQSNRVTSLRKPWFTLVPRDQTLTKGSLLTLQCQARGEPAPTIEWTRNDQPITDHFRTLFSPEVNNRMTISDVQTSDSGTYQCTATNRAGRVTASARITILEPPAIIEAPVDQILEAGEDAVFYCQVEGDPTPTVTWFRKGRVITPGGRISITNGGSRVVIRNVAKDDQTTYLCRAQNAAGTMDAGADLLIKERAAPTFTRRPVNLVVNVGDTAEFPCSATGDPTPTITWRHDGAPIENGNRYRIEAEDTLVIIRATESHQGLYECRAENELGFFTVAAFLSVQSTSSDLSFQNSGNHRGSIESAIQRSVSQAQSVVSRAINNTMRQLFDPNHRPRGPADLVRLVRFPAPHVQDTIRAAEVYERALTFVRQYVQEGHSFNFSSDYSPADLDLSPENLQLMANLSGCLVHRRHLDCSDWCFHSKYRTYDGSCNNLQNPMWGASETALRRLLRPIYENSFNTPVGWDLNRRYHGLTLPSARQVSSTIVAARMVTPADDLTHMLMQWGQFLDHDMDLAPPTVSTESFLDGADCALTCDHKPPCFPIPIPESDERITTRRCMEFVRTSAICGSGATSVLYGRVQSREQLNVLTSYMDASQVYGSSEAEALHLRHKGADADGRLRQGIVTESGKFLMPFADHWPIDCRRDQRESDVGCFMGGDIRVNEQLALLAMHTLWFREHNRLASELKRINSHWNDERLYQEARKIVGALMQRITYDHWLPKVLGPRGMELLGPYRGYDPSVDATVSNEFATAALRFGHTLINPVLQRLNATFQPIPQGHVHLRNAFFSPFRILEEGGIDPLLRGLFAIPAKLKVPDQLVNTELTEHLFRQVNHVPLDLAAINVQRGRDHGLPSYNEYRRWCNLTVAETFYDLRHDIRDRALRDRLKAVYGHPGNIDLWVGGVSEDVVEGARVGPTFLCILVDQFRRLRDGDRFFYENPGVFRPDQLTQLKQSSLARVLCDNGDSIRNVTLDVFTLPDKQAKGYISCDDVPREDLRPWLECCDSCHRDGSLGRSRRSTDAVSYPSDRPQSATVSVTSNQDDADVDEERLEGIEDVVAHLEKMVRKLTRKVRHLQQTCHKGSSGFRNVTSSVEGCTEEDGTQHHRGERWFVDRCTECECQKRKVVCKVLTECSLA